MDKTLYRASLVLVVIGLCVAIYMTIYKLTSNDSMCFGSGNCHTVNASPYSEINGIPVAVYGVVGYSALLLALLFETRNAFMRQNATLVIFGLALCGFLFTLWFIYAEVVLIKALCPFCVTSQIAMTLIFILAIVRLIRQPQL